MAVSFPTTTSGFERSTAETGVNWDASLESVNMVLRAQVCISNVTLDIIRYTWSCYFFAGQDKQNPRRWFAANCRGGGAN